MGDHGYGAPSTAAPIMSAFGEIGEGRPQAGRLVTRDEGRLHALVIGRMDAYDDLLRQALDALCLHIDLAPGEDAAHAHLARERCDLILLLLPLADSDGPALCRRLRAADGHVPLVILDIVGTVEDAVASLDAGSDAYIVEPFDAGELRARLAALLRRHGPTRQPKPTPPHTVTDAGAQSNGPHSNGWIAPAPPAHVIDGGAM
jgi:DNA-binding response OmpR family regulator